MPTASALRIVVPDMSRHGDEVAQLITTVFHEQPSPETVARIRGMADLPNWVRLDDCRIGLLDGRVVTSITVFRYLTRIGSARLVTAGIGAVATHPEYRKRGLMRDTFAAMVAGLRPAGYELSVLFGIPDFYWQFGYVRAWSDDTVTVRAPNLRPTREAPAVEDCSGPDLSEELIACMNRWQEGLDGTAVRPTHGGRNKHHGEAKLAMAWRNASGDLDGSLFLKLEESRVVVEDAYGDPEAIIALIAKACAEQEKPEVVFPLLPYRSPLSRRLRLGECQATRHCRRNGGALARTVDLAACLAKLCPDLSTRLTHSRRHDWHGTLLVSDGREEVGLRLGHGLVQVTAPGTTPHRILAGDHAASLVFGTEDPADTLARPGVSATGDAAELAAILFPELDPQLPSMDRY